MKDTNAIEKALEKKIDLEISAIVASFISQLQDLYDTYGGTNYYDIVYNSQEKEITSLTKEKVRTILQKMIKENHGDAMLAKKTNQLLAKLEIL
jgi:phosphoglucomutase